MIIIITMVNHEVFTTLLMCMCFILCHSQGVQLWTLTTSYPLRSRPILLRKDRPNISTACWHMNNQIITTTKRRHAPKKHTHKKHILFASIVKQEGVGGSAGHSSTASEEELLSVPQLSFSYLINIGTGIYTTQLGNQTKNLRAIKKIFVRLLCLGV